MIASLPMYLSPESRPAHDAFWVLVRDGLRERGISAPESLTNETDPYTVWGDETLVLSHICNLPYRLHFRSRLTRIAGSDYPLEDCAPGYYRARFIVRRDHPARTPEDLIESPMAFNDGESQSGWGAAASWAADRGARLCPALRTGSHEASLLAVASGAADYATIDAWTFELLKRRLPEAEEVRVVGSTAQSPGMTFVTRSGQNPQPFREALVTALEALPGEYRSTLGLRGFPILPEDEFDIPVPPMTGNHTHESAVT